MVENFQWCLRLKFLCAGPRPWTWLNWKRFLFSLDSHIQSNSNDVILMTSNSAHLHVRIFFFFFHASGCGVWWLQGNRRHDHPLLGGHHCHHTSLHDHQRCHIIASPLFSYPLNPESNLQIDWTFTFVNERHSLFITIDIVHWISLEYHRLT